MVLIDLLQFWFYITSSFHKMQPSGAFNRMNTVAFVLQSSNSSKDADGMVNSVDLDQTAL